jgi:Transposase DDE domain
LGELHIDRASLRCILVRERPEELEVYCKAWPVRNGSRFPKTPFELDWQRQLLRCPNQQKLPFVPGGVVQFPAKICQACPLQERCTTSRNGRSVSIHPDEALLFKLRECQLTAMGRAKLRERVAVEQALAHIGHWQGQRVHSRGLRKNLFDLRRCAVVHNLPVLARSQQLQPAA